MVFHNFEFTCVFFPSFFEVVEVVEGGLPEFLFRGGEVGLGVLEEGLELLEWGIFFSFGEDFFHNFFMGVDGEVHQWVLEEETEYGGGYDVE